FLLTLVSAMVSVPQADPLARQRSMRLRLQALLPKIVLSPTAAITLVFVYGFMAWTGLLSVSASKMMPNYTLVGMTDFTTVWLQPRWWVALDNLAIFGVLYIGFSTAVGLLLAILLDQKIRAEGVLRTIYLYPMAISFIVTGTAWKWMLNPGLGIEKLMHDWG